MAYNSNGENARNTTITEISDNIIDVIGYSGHSIGIYNYLGDDLNKIVKITSIINNPAIKGSVASIYERRGAS